MKRFIALILALATLFALAPAAAAEDSKADLQAALLETAKAFYYHNPYMQYDSAWLNKSKDNSRSSCYIAPEDATKDRTIYTVCSSFCHEIYYNAFGYELNRSYRECITQKMFSYPNAGVEVLHYDKTEAPDGREEAIQKFLATLEVGDVIVYVQDDGSGHAMFYAGDISGDGKGDILHSWGGKYNMETGVDSVEKKGNIALDTAEEFLTGTSGYLRKCKGFSILRPIVADAAKCVITPATRARLATPGLDIERTVSTGLYGSVPTGGELTYTIFVENHNTKDYSGLAVTEVIPQGTELVKADGATVTDRNLAWSMNIKAGGTATVSYTVKVTASRGTLITAGGGAVADIPSNTLYTEICGPMPDAAKLQAVSEKTELLEGISGPSFAKKFYREALGKELDISNVTSMVKTLFTTSTKEGSACYTFKDDGSTLANMVVRHYLGGQNVVTPDVNNGDRVLELRVQDLQAGDVLIAATLPFSDAKSVVYVYDGKQLVYSKLGKLNKSTGDSAVEDVLASSVFFLLRPSLAYDTLPDAKTITFNDVKQGDWYYTYVQDLALDGVISGMSATTFAPKNTLTYGQALKLIILALGAEEQPAGSHWASGYMEYAKKKKWISGDVNLNASITRLQFCQIAAKAKNATRQPGKNPFTDCSDTSVLALYRLGVIAGISETTFAPNNLLTRAQIAKIIWCLRSV